MDTPGEYEGELYAAITFVDARYPDRRCRYVHPISPALFDLGLLDGGDAHCQIINIKFRSLTGASFKLQFPSQNATKEKDYDLCGLRGPT